MSAQKSQIRTNVGLTVWAVFGPLLFLVLLSAMLPRYLMENQILSWRLLSAIVGGSSLLFLRIAWWQHLLLISFYLVIAFLIMPYVLVVLACAAGDCI